MARDDGGETPHPAGDAAGGETPRPGGDATGGEASRPAGDAAGGGARDAAGGRGRGPVTVIVDGANVVGSRPDGWWRDRAGAAVRLYDNLARLAARGAPGLPAEDLSLVLVLEGAAKAAMRRIGAEREGDREDRGDGEGGADRAGPSGREGGGDRAGQGDGEGRGYVRVVAAPGSGDDEIVRLAEGLPGPRIVVTADRELRRRVAAAGAEAVGPSWLFDLL
jgi:hypothetical protein